MPSIGAESLHRKYNGNSLAVAEALILGEIEGYELPAAQELISLLLLETARVRLSALGELDAKHINKVRQEAPKRKSA